MARNFERTSNAVFKKLRSYGQDASAFYIRHDTFIAKGREELLKPLNKVNEIKEVNEVKEVDEAKEVQREVTPKDEEILVGGALMTTKAEDARNKALAQNTKYKTIMKIDSTIENNNGTKDAVLVLISLEGAESRETENTEVQSVRSPPNIHYGKLKTIDQINIVIPKERKGYTYVDNPGFCCTVS